MNLGTAAIVAALTGFVALSYEILWYRAVSFASGSSPAAFGELLGFYLAGLALGAYATRSFCDVRQGAGNPVHLRRIAGFILAANTVGFIVLPACAWFANHSRWSNTFPLITLSSAMLGAVLPLVSHFGVSVNRNAGTDLSYLYASNIVGSVLGSFLTGFLFLQLWPIRTTAVLLLVIGCAVAMLTWIFARASRYGALGGLLLIGGLGGALTFRSGALFDGFYEKLLYGGQYDSNFRFSHVIENRSGVITVTPDAVVYGSGAYDGRISTSLRSDLNQIIRAYAVGAMHPMPRRVLMVGLAGGAWAQVIVNHPGVQKLTIVEINPGYLQLIPQYPQVSDLLTNPKVEIIIDDGRRWLSRHHVRFDLIVANTTIHWRAHTTNLLSVEYLHLIRDHLAPGGVYYFNTTGSTAALKTAFTIFPFGYRFMNFAAVSDSPFIFDRERLRTLLQNYRIHGRPVLDTGREADRAKLEELVSTGDVETRTEALKRVAAEPLVTDDNMVTEWHPTP